jgi:hypothetical protein
MATTFRFGSHVEDDDGFANAWVATFNAVWCLTVYDLGPALSQNRSPLLPARCRSCVRPLASSCPLRYGSDVHLLHRQH